MIAKLRVKGSTDSGYSEQHVLMLSCNYNIQRLLKSLYAADDFGRLCGRL